MSDNKAKTEALETIIKKIKKEKKDKYTKGGISKRNSYVAMGVRG